MKLYARTLETELRTQVWTSCLRTWSKHTDICDFAALPLMYWGSHEAAIQLPEKHEIASESYEEDSVRIILLFPASSIRMFVPKHSLSGYHIFLWRFRERVVSLWKSMGFIVNVGLAYVDVVWSWMWIFSTNFFLDIKILKLMNTAYFIAKWFARIL